MAGWKDPMVLVGIIGATGTIVAAVITSIVAPTLFTPRLTTPPPPTTTTPTTPSILRAANAYSFIKKWGSYGTGDGQFSRFFW